MFTPFDQLRTEAATLRDERISEAKEQFRLACRRIDDLERTLTLGAAHKTKVQRRVISYLSEIIGNGEPFTIGSLWKAVQERFPYWRTNYAQVKRCAYRMLKAGDVKRIGFDVERRGVYLRIGMD